MNPFSLLLISHVLGDGIFTSSRLAILKRNSGLFYQVLAIFCHTSIHAFFAGLLLLLAGGHWLKAALLVFALHFLIDFTRSRVEMMLVEIFALKMAKDITSLMYQAAVSVNVIHALFQGWYCE